MLRTCHKCYGPYNVHSGKISCPYRAVPHGTKTENQDKNSCSLLYFKFLVTVCVSTSQKMIGDMRPVVNTVDMRLSYFIMYFFVLNSITIDSFKVLYLMYKNLHTLLMFAQYFISLSYWLTSVYLQIGLKTLYK